MYRKWFILVCLLLSKLSFSADDPRHSCYQVNTAIEATLHYADKNRPLKASSGGSAFVVDSRGFLVTCRHVVNIGKLLGDAIHNHAHQPASILTISEIHVSIAVRNPFGLTFATTYRPEIRWESDGEVYEFNVNFIDAGIREDYKRDLMIVAEHNEADLAMLKVRPKNPLPPLSVSELPLILIRTPLKDRPGQSLRALPVVNTELNTDICDVVARQGALLAGKRKIVNGYSCQKFSMAVWPGDSGAPIVDLENTVVSVVMARDDPVNTNCRAAGVPGDILKRFVYDITDPVPPAPEIKTSGAGSAGVSLALH